MGVAGLDAIKSGPRSAVTLAALTAKGVAMTRKLELHRGVPLVHELAYNLLADSVPSSPLDARPAGPTRTLSSGSAGRREDSWVEQLVAETERTAAARRVERERRLLYREALMPVRIPDACWACGGSGVQGSGMDSWTCEECGER